MSWRGGVILSVWLLGCCTPLCGQQQRRFVAEISGPVLELPHLTAFEIPVCDMSAEQLDGLRGVKGVTEVRRANAGAVIVFQPYADLPWEDQYRWKKGAEKVFKQAPFQSAFGGVQVKECRLLGPRDDAAFPELRATFNCQVIFPNAARLVLRGYAQAGPGMIEHEMVRDLFGARQEMRPAGGGHALVAHVPAGAIAVWKVSPQLFARLEGSWNEGLLAACVRRFGSQTPADHRLDQAAWVQEEIRFRVEQLGRALQWERQGKGECVWRFAPYLTDQFPDVFARFGTVDLNDPQAKTVKWLRDVQAFLQVNQMKFRYDPEAWGFILPGQRPDAVAPPLIPPQYRNPVIYGSR